MTIKEYRWVPVIREKVLMRKGKVVAWINARYDVKKKIIILYDRFLKRTDITQKAILEHEYAHHIYYTKIPLVYRKIWTLVSNWKLIKPMNILWLTEYTENAYSTSHAESHPREDFAECIEIPILENKFSSYVSFKVKVAVSMYNYFSK